MMTRETITVGRLRFRVGPWQSDAGVAHLSMPAKGRSPGRSDIEAVLDLIRQRGYSSVLTSALEEQDTPAFTALGFAEHDRLHVLGHDLTRLDSLPRAPGDVELRRRRRGDRERAIDIDARAFPAFWRLDEDGLADAEAATPSSRFRVAVVNGAVLGYAVTGRGGPTGFLQRLATHPDAQRRGIGSALVTDALAWCARRHCDQVYVNTQVTNTGALSLYRSLGFTTTATDLVVLRWEQQ